MLEYINPYIIFSNLHFPLTMKTFQKFVNGSNKKKMYYTSMRYMIN